MQRKKFDKDKLQNFAIIGTLGLILIAVIFVIFLPSMKVKKNEELSEIIEHNLYTYKNDGSFSKYNTLSKKYLSEISISNKNNIKYDESFTNPFKIANHNDNLIISSPYSNEIVIAKENGNKIKEVRRIKLNNTPNNIKVFENTLIITYINGTTLDLYDLNNLMKINTLSFDNPIDSIESDNNHLYVASGKYIHIIKKDIKSKEDHIKIYTGAKTISLYKANDNFLYAGNIFASDSKNSLLLKIDLKNMNILDILELEKEYPVQLVDNGSDLVVVCKGLKGGYLDGISVIDKDIFTRKANIATGDAPNNLTLVDSEFAYVSHDSGLVTLIDMRDGYSKHSTFNLSGIRAIHYK